MSASFQLKISYLESRASWSTDGPQVRLSGNGKIFIFWLAVCVTIVWAEVDLNHRILMVKNSSPPAHLPAKHPLTKNLRALASRLFTWKLLNISFFYMWNCYYSVQGVSNFCVCGLKCDHSNESYWVELFCGVVCDAIQSSSNLIEWFFTWLPL